MNDVIAYIRAEYGDEFKYELRIGRMFDDENQSKWYLKVSDFVNKTRFLCYSPEDINEKGVGWLIEDIETSTKWSETDPIF